MADVKPDGRTDTKPKLHSRKQHKAIPAVSGPR